MSAFRPLIHEVIQIELRQIKHLAILGCMARDEFTRDIVLSMLMEEAEEAKFWNTVDAAYRGVPLPVIAPCPGMPPAPCPGMPPAPCPGMPPTPCPGMPSAPCPGMPSTPYPGMPSAPCPGMPSWPYPGVPSEPCPGMPSGPCPGMPPGPCPGWSPSPGIPTGGTTMPAWNPAPGITPGLSVPECGVEKGFYSEEAKKDVKDDKK